MSITQTFAQKAISYFLNLEMPSGLLKGITVLNPYENNSVKKIVTKIFLKYFDDSQKRIFILGINPGRFGGGITCISFTDPVALEAFCGIKNYFDKKTELSSKYVYSFIEQTGSVEEFYSRFYISALYPLALIKDGKNYNYYDDIRLYKAIRPGIIDALNKQFEFGASKKFAVCLGRKNYKFLSEINNEYNFFDQIAVLDHPRFIMQYRKKQLNYYLEQYVSVLKSAEKFLG